MDGVLEASAKVVRIYHQGVLVAQHPTSSIVNGQSTTDAHMPGAHQHHKRSPERLMTWGHSIGSSTQNVVQQMLLRKKHPEQSYRTCLGLLNLSRTYGDGRLEQACQDALMAEKPYYGFIKNLLENHREGKLTTESATTPDIQHSNVRGPSNYH